jgi:23S rRNA pseudouridine2605 synthase
MEASTLFHVGRLDKESEGLLLLTNDGILAQQLLHPSHGVDKEYEVLLDQPYTPKAAAALKKGTWIEGAVARVESVHQFAPDKIRLVLHQGIKRQIRVMLGQLGFKVKRLIRTRIGPLKIRNLDSGNYRDLFPQEVEALRAATLVSKTALKAARKERFKKPMRKPIMVGVYRDKKKSEGHLGEPRHGATAAPRPSRGRPTLTTRTASPRTALRAQRAEARPFRRARKN